MKRNKVVLFALVVGAVVTVAFFARWGEDVQCGQDEGLRTAVAVATAGEPAAAAAVSAPRQTPTARGTYPFEVALADGVRPRELKGIVTRTGARIVSYLPRGGAIVEATDAVAAKLRAMPEISSVGEFKPSGKFAPGFRERLARAGADESVRFSLSLINAEDAQAVSRQIAEAGGTVYSMTDPKASFQWVSAELPAARIAAFADQAEVKWLEPVSRIRFCNATAVKPDHLDVERAWDKGDGLGLSGAGQVIGHMDTGIDYGTTNNLTPEFAGHILAYFNEFGGAVLSDTKGHGTHTAGSIVGQGVAALGGKFRGVAYGAQLVHHAVGDPFYVSFCDLNTVFAKDYDLGARIHSDSWGADEVHYYDELAQSVDAFVWEHPNFLPVIAAGNKGPGPGSVDSPAIAKSALAVGSSENFAGYELNSEDNFPEFVYTNAVRRGLANSSSRGALTGAVKPDVVAPGECIVSVRSLAVKDGIMAVYTNETACGTRYGWMNGTSAATPQAAGAMALMREWYMKTQGKEPSAAMLVAMSVGGAHTLYPGRYSYPTNTQMTVSGPNSDEGWGELGVAATLAPTNGVGIFLYDCKPESSGELLKDSIVLYVTNSVQTLTVALSWTDYPSDTSKPGLVNDYDLVLCAPDGTAYYPNGLDGADTNNVHEVTVVTNAMAGRWTACIRSDNVREQGGAIALYARGALGTEAELPRQPKTHEVKDDAELTDVLKDVWSGDTIKLAAGTYTPFTISNLTLTIVGAGADRTFIDAKGDGRCVWGAALCSNDRLVIEGVTLENGRAVDGAGICGGTLRHSVIRNCQADWCGGGAASAVLDHCVISNCWVQSHKDVDFLEEKKPYFEGGGAHQSKLYNCLVVHCGVSNLVAVKGRDYPSCGGGVSQCDIFNVSVIDSQMFWEKYNGISVDAKYIKTNENQYAVAFAGRGEVWGSVQNSLISRVRLNGKENVLGFATVKGQCAHLTALATNDFVNFAADDFRLSSNAVSAIDRGISTYLDNYPKSSLSRLDLAGTNRIQGLSVDLGCYESPYTNTAPGEVSGAISWPSNVLVLAMGVGDPSVKLQDVSMVNDSYQMFQHAAAFLPVLTSNIVHIAGTNVTSAAVSNGMDRLVAQAGTNDLVLLTISTHGVPNSNPTNGVPIAGDNNCACLSAGGYLYPDQVRDFEVRLKAKGASLVCVYDCCFSGGFAQMAGVPALAAATEQEMSFDTKPDGCFTAKFLSCWRRPPAEADLDGDGVLSFYEMGRLLTRLYDGTPGPGVQRAEVTIWVPASLVTMPLRRMPTSSEPLKVLTKALSPMYSGMTYCYQLQATGGDGTNTWKALSELPGGLTLDTDGCLHGIPQSVKMPKDLAVRVSDASGATATATLPVEDVLFRTNSRPRIVSQSVLPGVVYRQQDSEDWTVDIRTEQPMSTNDIFYVFTCRYMDETGSNVTKAVTNATGRFTVSQTLFAIGPVSVDCGIEQKGVSPVIGNLTWTVMNDPATPTKYLFIDPGRGEEDGDGTASSPFWSFESAIEAANKAAESNIVVYADSSKNNHVFEIEETIDVAVTNKTVAFQPWKTATSGDFNVVLDGQEKYGCVMVPDSVTNKVTFKNFTLRNGHTAERGGGANSVTLVDSVITNCAAKKAGGGAAYCTLKNCQIVGCSGYDGGGAFDSELSNCRISGCEATRNGGGASKSMLYNCRLTGCVANGNGGGASTSDLYNCRLTGCVANGNGGGASTSDLYNCLVLKNKAPDGYGGGASQSSLYNCTLVGNTASECGGYCADTKEGGDLSVAVLNTIILDNGADGWYSNNDKDLFRRVFTDGDPKFVDAANGDYRLRADSPCIDYGYSGNDDLPTVDLAGKPRLRGAEIDLGCYEFQRHAAFYPGTLDVSTNAQVVGTVLYAQGSWRLAVNDEAKSWLSADVTGGSVTNTLRFTFAENATGADRSAVVSVFTNGSDVAVQQITVRQVGCASGCAGTRRGVFVGCAKYGPEPDDETEEEEWKPWQKETPGADEDARFYSGLWCGADKTNDSAVCRQLINENATSNSVLAALDTIIDKLGPTDEFMLTISGHGETTVPGWKNSFCLYPNKEEIYFAQISNCLIRAAAKCTKAICCIDACNAAGVYKFADQLTCDGEVTDRRDMPRLTFAAASSKSEPYKNESKIAFIVASDYDQEAESASDDETNGQFTGQLKAGYDSGAADADGNGALDLHELYRYAYYMSSYGNQSQPASLVQGRCYNKPLLLKTIVRSPVKAVKPDVVNPLNPYYVDFINWIQDGTLVEFEKPASAWHVTDVVTNAENRVPLAGGGSMTLAEAFVAGYAPVKDGVTNAPFRVAISLTNGTPYLIWSPDRSRDAVPLRTYEIKANTSLTNQTNWTTLPASATPEQLKPYNFFKVDVKLRQ